jgi:4-diphosphocytidyl-2-C-methyl-D-erythritol kinase
MKVGCAHRQHLAQKAIEVKGGRRATVGTIHSVSLLYGSYRQLALFPWKRPPKWDKDGVFGRPKPRHMAGAPMLVQARAKLNLRLDVLGKQLGGLHGVRSLIGELVFGDDVEISERAGGFSVETEGADIPERENLVWLAAMRLGIDLSGLHVRVRKRIPMQAGLGGGSSDAAALLRGLRDVFAARGAPISDEAIRNAAQIGSDVPACLVRGFKRVEGTGDVVVREQLPTPPWGLLLLRPPVGVPTSEAYRLLDAGRSSAPLSSDPSSERDLQELCGAIQTNDFPRACSLLQNDFQPVVELLFPSVAEARQRLREAGAAATLLCGSGSCVAGFFETRAAAAAAHKTLKTGEGEWATATCFADA